MAILNHEHDFQLTEPGDAVFTPAGARQLGLLGINEGVWWVRGKVCGAPGCDAALVYPDVTNAFDEGVGFWDPVLRRGGREALEMTDNSEFPGFVPIDLALLRAALGT